MNLHAIVRELIDHSTLGGFDKSRLKFHLDTDDPETESPDPVEEPTTPETPDQELARLRAENAALKAPAEVKTDAV